MASMNQVVKATFKRTAVFVLPEDVVLQASNEQTEGENPGIQFSWYIAYNTLYYFDTDRYVLVKATWEDEGALKHPDYTEILDGEDDEDEIEMFNEMDKE